MNIRNMCPACSVRSDLAETLSEPQLVMHKMIDEYPSSEIVVPYKSAGIGAETVAAF